MEMLKETNIFLPFSLSVLLLGPYCHSFIFNLHVCDSQVNILAMFLLLTDTPSQSQFQVPTVSWTCSIFLSLSLFLCTITLTILLPCQSWQPMILSSFHLPCLSHFLSFLYSQLEFNHFNYFLANIHNSIFYIFFHHNLLANINPK